MVSERIYTNRELIMEIKVGKKIKLLRKKNDVTQDKLAAHLGVTPQAVSRWESETCGVTPRCAASLSCVTSFFFLSSLIFFPTLISIINSQLGIIFNITFHIIPQLDTKVNKKLTLLNDLLQKFQKENCKFSKRLFTSRSRNVIIILSI